MMKTNIVDIVRPEYVKIDLQARTRDEALRELIDLEAIQGNITDKNQGLKDLLAREDQFTTKMMEYIAIPHAKSEAVEKAMVLVGKSKDGIDWRPDADFENSNYEDRVFITFMILVPANAEGNDHLKILAMLARCLAKKDFRQNLIDKKDGEELNRYLVDAIKAKMEG
jgi:fructose-specific phosphotransferase system IIA component